MVKKRGLGKSLDALLAYTSTEVQSAPENRSDGWRSISSIIG